VFCWFDNRATDELVDAMRFVGRAAYAIGRYPHLPEPERVARARALAMLSVVTDVLIPDSIHAAAGMLGRGGACRRAEPLIRLGTWLAEKAPGVTVDDAIAAVPELARLGQHRNAAEKE
jgi:hypothetical protein